MIKTILRGTLFLLLILLPLQAFSYKKRSANDFAANLNQVMKVLYVGPSDLKSLSREELNDVKSLKNSLFISGIRFKETQVDKLTKLNLRTFDVIIIPYVSGGKLNDAEASKVTEAVNQGTNLLFAGNTKMNKLLGVELRSKKVVVSQIRDLQFPDDTLSWTKPAKLRPVLRPAAKENLLCVDHLTNQPLVVKGKYGKGNFIYFATMFDPDTNKGYSRYPFLIETLDNVFGLKSLAERQVMEVYFDPGMRDSSVDLDTLAAWWHKNKIKRIHAGGWYYDYPGVDYGKLIKACHDNGIVVYCWLETPMISSGFWDRHPEWREKTAFLKDALIDWRSLINLADPDCRKQVFEEIGEMLTKFNWDGVNLAELYFEPSPVGPRLAQNFTPMNDIVRNEFKAKGGFDPVLLFDKKSPYYWETNHKAWKSFAEYRKDLCFRLKDSFLDFLSGVKNQKKDFDLMLTVLDVSLTPELSDNIAEKTENTLALYKKYNCTMQIEDPSNCWGLTPDRYIRMGKFYRKYIKHESQLLFDCNVVTRYADEFEGFPSLKPTGEEVRQVAYYMSQSHCRPTFYSEDCINENDFRNISSVLARKAKVEPETETRWKVSSPFTITVDAGIQDVVTKLDGKPWVTGENGKVIVPKGIHKLEFEAGKASAGQIRLINISGELLRAEFTDNGLSFAYSEDVVSCYVSVDKQPSAILVDGVKTDCQVYKKNNAEFVVKLPSGKHEVRIQ
ncbi:MAG: hypothetical protein Q8928_11730 [Bacteroidota bacterium]|nr:hypothetical protein [Bacteroidota bacterium]